MPLGGRVESEGLGQLFWRGWWELLREGHKVGVGELAACVNAASLLKKQAAGFQGRSEAGDDDSATCC